MQACRFGFESLSALDLPPRSTLPLLLMRKPMRRCVACQRSDAQVVLQHFGGKLDDVTVVLAHVVAPAGAL